MNNDNYNIYSVEKLKTLINDKGIIKGDIVIRGNEIESLGNLKQIQGNFGIDSNSLSDLGDLKYVDYDFWVSNAQNLKSLKNLETVGGDLSLRYSEIIDLGKLTRVGKKLSLRDTKIKNISSLKIVKVLFLPKRFKDKNIDFIKTETVKYWSDKKYSIGSSKEKLKDVGGQNLRYNILITKDNSGHSSIGWGKVWDSNLGFKVSLLKYKIPKSPMENFYISPKALSLQEKQFIFYREEIDKNLDFLNKFSDDYEIEKLRNKLIFNLLENLTIGKIDCKTFIDKTEYYETVFSKFKSTTKLEFLPIYELFNKNLIINKLTSKNYFSSNYSKIHELELRLKKRVLTGKNLVQRVKSLNEYIIKNIEEYYKFIDNKLEDFYSENYSFINSLLGKTKTVSGLNNEFPKQFKIESNGHSSKYYMSRRENSFIYIEKNKDKPNFKQYSKILEKFNNDEIDKMKKNHWNNGELWLSYNENPLSYYGHDTNGFIYLIENSIHNFFYEFVLSFQNDFRVSKGIPKIGEGWVSETELFYMIKDYYINETVKQHGKPKWLGRQHVDIWIPKHKIGIEYQGLQHDKPIEFFGGEIAFKKNKERDERKRKLFKKNNSTLIEVRKNYNFESLVKEINNNINK
jgi:hypothetical protein